MALRPPPAVALNELTKDRAGDASPKRGLGDPTPANMKVFRIGNRQHGDDLPQVETAGAKAMLRVELYVPADAAGSGHSSPGRRRQLTVAGEQLHDRHSTTAPAKVPGTWAGKLRLRNASRQRLAVTGHQRHFGCSRSEGRPKVNPARRRCTRADSRVSRGRQNSRRQAPALPRSPAPPGNGWPADRAAVKRLDVWFLVQGFMGSLFSLEGAKSVARPKGGAGAVSHGTTSPRLQNPPRQAFPVARQAKTIFARTIVRRHCSG